MATIERGWRRLISEVGVRFDHPEAQRLFREAGQSVDDEGVVRLDPDFALEQIALAPRAFELRARNPRRSVMIGGDHMVFTNVAGPAVRVRGRRPPRRDDGRLRALHQARARLPARSTRRAACRASPRTCRSTRATSTCRSRRSRSRTSRTWARSSTARRRATASRSRRSRSADATSSSADRSTYGIANVNSPLTYDAAMVDVLFAYAEANQAIVVTPFLLMGAMSPVTIPAALVQQTVEALAGVALVQLIRPGAPVVLGSFLSHTDMQSGSPGFGGPGVGARAALLGPDRAAPRAAVAGGRRRPHLEPAARRPGGLRGADHAPGGVPLGRQPDAARGRLARERPRRELREVRHRHRAPAHRCAPSSRPSRSTRTASRSTPTSRSATAATSSARRTRSTRFRDCFYRPILATTSNFERWTRDGALEMTARADVLWRAALERYEPPPIDDGIRAELHEYAARRRRELGD